MSENRTARTQQAPQDDAEPRATTLAGHHAAALVVVAPLLTALAIDWVVTGVTGTRTFVTDNAVGPTWAGLVVSAFLAASCVALVVVLLREKRLFLEATAWGRTLRGCRRVLIVGLVGLLVGTSVISPLLNAAGITSGLVYDVSGLLAAGALVSTFGPALVIGLTQLRRNELGLGGRVLGLAVPAIVLTAAVALLADDWASPVLFTMTVLAGIAVVGVGVRRRG